MDDSLETPSALPPKAPLGDVLPDVEDEQSSDEEDGGLDWRKLLYESFQDRAELLLIQTFFKASFSSACYS